MKIMVMMFGYLSLMAVVLPLDLEPTLFLFLPEEKFFLTLSSCSLQILTTQLNMNLCSWELKL